MTSLEKTFRWEKMLSSSIIQTGNTLRTSMGHPEGTATADSRKLALQCQAAARGVRAGSGTTDVRVPATEETASVIDEDVYLAARVTGARGEFGAANPGQTTHATGQNEAVGRVVA